MPFFNQTSLIVDDQMRSLYNFLYDNKKVVYYSFNKISSRSKKSIILKDVKNDFDGAINQKGEIYLACKTEDNSIILANSKKEFSDWKTIIEESEYDIQNINIKLVNDEIHIFYCISTDIKNQYKIIHYIENKNNATSQEICTISKSEILNPIEIVVEKDEILLAHYSLVENIEQLFIQSYCIKDHTWNEPVQLTSNKNNKLYLDVLLTNKNQLHIVYCQYVQGNLVVKYEKFKKENKDYKKLIEREISNYANAQLPILIHYGEMLWICWTEYNYIASRYLEDKENEWSDIYLWNQSKTSDFVRYKYITNQKSNMQKLNYSFGRADNLGFIGFGNLKNTSIIPLKQQNGEKQEKKQEKERELKKVEEKNNEIQKENHHYNDDKTLEALIKANKELQEKIDLLEKQMKDIVSKIQIVQNNKEKKLQDNQQRSLQEINDRLHTVENFLIQNTRGFKKMKDGK